MLWIGVSASWSSLDPAYRRGSSSSISVDVPLFSLPSIQLSLPLPSLFDEALHLRHRCISELLLCLLSSWPLSAIYGSSEVTFLIIIPTGRSLTRTQPSSCALVTYGSRVTNPRAAWFMICRSKGPIANRTSWLESHWPGGQDASPLYSITA